MLGSLRHGTDDEKHPEMKIRPADMRSKEDSR